MIDLNSMSVVELKAMAFDEEQRIKVSQNNIQIIYKKLEEKLSKRAEEPKKETVKELKAKKPVEIKK